MNEHTRLAQEAADQAAEILTRARTDQRDLTDDEDAAYTTLVTRAEREQQLSRVETAMQHPGSMERAYDGINISTRTPEPFAGVDNLTRSIGSTKNRDAALSTFEKGSAVRGLSNDEREALMDRVENVPGAAEYALAHGTPEYRSAFTAWAKQGGRDVIYSREQQAAIMQALEVRTALNITTGASGQFSLPTQFDPTIIRTGTAAINPIRDLARVVQGTQNVWNGVSSNNITTYWHAEAAALTDGSPTLAHPLVTAGHLTAWVPGSWEFFDDSPAVQQLPGLINEAFGYAESTAFVSGSGTSQPLGVVTAISATIASTVTATTRGSFTTASFVDLYAVVNAMPSRYEGTSTWIANKKTFNLIRQMSQTGGAGSLYWGGLDGVTPESLLDSPWRKASDVLSTTTTGTVLAVLGDFSQYLILDVLGTQIELVSNLVNSSGIPTGQRGLIARKRTGGNVTDLNAFRFLLM